MIAFEVRQLHISAPTTDTLPGEASSELPVVADGLLKHWPLIVSVAQSFHLNYHHIAQSFFV